MTRASDLRSESARRGHGPTPGPSPSHRVEPGRGGESSCTSNVLKLEQYEGTQLFFNVNEFLPSSMQNARNG